jgi:CheY-like chemotaxis protein
MTTPSSGRAWRLVAAEPDLEAVGTAADGQRAVELAEREQPDVIVLDLSMPELDGINATEQLRRRSPRTRGVAAVVPRVGVGGRLRARRGRPRVPVQGRPATEVLDGIRHMHAGGTVFSDLVRYITDPTTRR